MQDGGISALKHTAEAQIDSTTNGTESPEDRIINTLRLTYGNKAQAARTLGIPRSTLYHLLERYEAP